MACEAGKICAITHLKQVDAPRARLAIICSQVVAVLAVVALSTRAETSTQGVFREAAGRKGWDLWSRIGLKVAYGVEGR